MRNKNSRSVFTAILMSTILCFFSFNLWAQAQDLPELSPPTQPEAATRFKSCPSDPLYSDSALGRLNWFKDCLPDLRLTLRERKEIAAILQYDEESKVLYYPTFASYYTEHQQTLLAIGRGQPKVETWVAPVAASVPKICSIPYGQTLAGWCKDSGPRPPPPTPEPQPRPQHDHSGMGHPGFNGR